MLETIKLWRSSQSFQLVSRASYFGHILRAFYGMSRAGYPRDWAALVVTLRMRRGSNQSPYASPHPRSWTEPARRWRTLSLQAILRRVVQFQRRAVFPALRSIVVNTEERQQSSRPKASNTLLYPRRRESYSQVFVTDV
jgi:hypothetical protein